MSCVLSSGSCLLNCVSCSTYCVPYHRISLDSSVQAKQSMEAQLEDELALRQGQIVKITHIIDKDWFR